MSKQIPAGKSIYGLLPTADVDGFDSLAELALDMRRPTTDYTARVIPRHDGAAVPLEDVHILWQQ